MNSMVSIAYRKLLKHGTQSKLNAVESHLLHVADVFNY